MNKKGGARAYYTYRDTRRNLSRYPSKAMLLKKERLNLGISRREQDRRRTDARQERVE